MKLENEERTLVLNNTYEEKGLFKRFLTSWLDYVNEDDEELKDEYYEDSVMYEEQISSKVKGYWSSYKAKDIVRGFKGLESTQEVLNNAAKCLQLADLLKVVDRYGNTVEDVEL